MWAAQVLNQDKLWKTDYKKILKIGCFSNFFLKIRILSSKVSCSYLSHKWLTELVICRGAISRFRFKVLFVTHFYHIITFSLFSNLLLLSSWALCHIAQASLELKDSEILLPMPLSRILCMPNQLRNLRATTDSNIIWQANFLLFW